MEKKIPRNNGSIINKLSLEQKIELLIDKMFELEKRIEKIERNYNFLGK